MCTFCYKNIQHVTQTNEYIDEEVYIQKKKKENGIGKCRLKGMSENIEALQL